MAARFNGGIELLPNMAMFLPMQQVPPDWKIEFVRGAFIFDEPAFRRLRAIARQYLGDDPTVEFTLELKDASKYMTSEIDELSQFPLHHLGDRKKFEISFRQNPQKGFDPYFSVTFNYIEPNSMIAVHNIDKSREIADQLKAFVVGTKYWYADLYTFPFWILQSGFFLIMLLSSLADLSNISGAKKIMTIATWSLGGVWCFENICRYFLFDHLVVNWGPESDRQVRRIAVRRTVALFIFLGIIVTASSGFFQALFSSK